MRRSLVKVVQRELSKGSAGSDGLKHPRNLTTIYSSRKGEKVEDIVLLTPTFDSSLLQVGEMGADL